MLGGEGQEGDIRGVCEEAGCCCRNMKHHSFVVSVGFVCVEGGSNAELVHEGEHSRKRPTRNELGMELRHALFPLAEEG